MAGGEMFSSHDAAISAGRRPSGYVVNIHAVVTSLRHSAAPHDVRARSTREPDGRALTGTYIKACSGDLGALGAWDVARCGTAIIRCGTGHPPAPQWQPDADDDGDYTKCVVMPQGYHHRPADRSQFRDAAAASIRRRQPARRRNRCGRWSMPP